MEDLENHADASDSDVVRSALLSTELSFCCRRWGCRRCCCTAAAYFATTSALLASRAAYFAKYGAHFVTPCQKRSEINLSKASDGSILETHTIPCLVAYSGFIQCLDAGTRAVALAIDPLALSFACMAPHPSGTSPRTKRWDNSGHDNPGQVSSLRSRSLRKGARGLATRRRKAAGSAQRK